MGINTFNINPYRLRNGIFLLSGAVLYFSLKLCDLKIPLLDNYGYDYLAGIFYYPTVEFLLVECNVRYKVKSSLHMGIILIMTLFAALFWEYITPLYRVDSVSDLHDLLAYMCGAVTLYLFYSFRLLKTPYAQYNH